MIIHILCTKLNYQTLDAWENTLNCELPKFEEYISFLDKRCNILQALNGTYNNKNQSAISTKPTLNKTKPEPSNKRANSLIATSNKIKCRYCQKAPHPLYSCEDFLKLSIQDRWGAVSNLGSCTGCLKVGHKIEHCKSTGRCRKCNKRHNYLLHPPENSTELSNTMQIDNTTIVFTINNCSTKECYASVLLSRLQYIFKIDMIVLYNVEHCSILDRNPTL